MTDHQTDCAAHAPLSDRDTQRLSALLKAAKPTPDAGREALLLDRIVAAAERAPRLAAVGAGPAVSVVTGAATPLRQARPLSRRAGAFGLLAASLIVGVLLGQTSVTDVAMAGFEDVTGLTLTTASLDLSAADPGFED